MSNEILVQYILHLFNATIDEMLIIYQHEKNNILFSYPILEVSSLVLKIDS